MNKQDLFAPIILIGFSLLSCQSKLDRLNKLALDREFQNVVIDDNSTMAPYQPCEPSIFVSPQDPKQMVAGIVLNKICYSHDGGKTWTLKVVESPYGVFGDPVITADRSGHFYFAHLADPSGQGRSSDSWLDRIVVQKSIDGGKTWNEGSYAGHRPPADQDKHWLAIDPKSNDIYMTWTEFDKYGSTDVNDKSRILFAKSTDGAATWSDAKSINQHDGNCIDSDLTPEGAVPAVGPNGEVYVAWAYDEKIYFDRSLDQGETWLDQDIIAAPQEGGWDIAIPGLGRANGMPVTATDLSNSPHRGNIYINYCDQSNGSDDTDVMLVKSSDGGANWSEPLRVNDDSPGSHQFFTWMSCDPVTGALYIIFYDRRGLSGTMTDVYLAYSFDGGKSFKNVKVSSEPFQADTGVFFGDYNNISAYDGVIRPIWTRLDQGRTSILTALINFR